MRVLLASVLLLASSAAGAQSVRAGIDAWQRSDYSAAVAIWQPLAERGDADAAFNLAQAYRLGRGVPVDLAAAQRWLERAAGAGHLDAQVTLGLLLFQNGNQAAGLRWLKTAAERGEPRAMLIYGTALFNGDGVPRDSVLAYAYVSRAAAQGLSAAKTALADMDAVIPLADRRKGVAMAIEKANAAKAEPPAPERPRTAAAATTRAAAAPKPGGGWRIQIGAFSQRASAEALFKRLSSRAPIAGHQPYFVSTGTVTRLQVGPYADRAAAVSACSALAARNQACFPVPPKP